MHVGICNMHVETQHLFLIRCLWWSLSFVCVCDVCVCVRVSFNYFALVLSLSISTGVPARQVFPVEHSRLSLLCTLSITYML